MRLPYPDTVTFVKVQAGSYANTKVVIGRADVNVIFIQNTGFQRTNYQEFVDSDAQCFPDPTNDFVIENANRLEGMYILAPMFGSDPIDSWYKVTGASVNRDHLLNNTIDNVQLGLKKTKAIPGVS